ncbi:MAG: hypothetical protein EZS28_012748 [Streblomastix strix]|uniref:Uncharacterized protein n=1 Tax=Streblomastix strix TaxID=222440 RepID=A0A5J4W9X2_9EUKA|nr:MAG: hypothetical protein EZS28_012748 [Streblomastix strix]
MPKCQNAKVAVTLAFWHFGILAFWHFGIFLNSEGIYNGAYKLRIYGREQKAEEHMIGADICWSFIEYVVTEHSPVEMRSKAPTLVIPGDKAIFNKKSVQVQVIHRRFVS